MDSNVLRNQLDIQRLDHDQEEVGEGGDDRDGKNLNQLTKAVECFF